MKFYQHIYGRVSKGFQGNSPGYQLAALSQDIKDEKELIDNLNKYSFFNYRNASENDYRFSFYQPIKGFLAFGVSHYAKDKVGALGSFAHNLVCTLDEFIKSGYSPVDILKSFTFFRKNEDELPDDRILPSINNMDIGVTQINEKWNKLALYIINSILSKSGSIPLVVQPAEETWELLGAINNLLPKMETTRFTFSTSFIDSLNFIDGFRLVFIPDKRFIPSSSYVFDIIHEYTELSIRKLSAYVEFIQKYPDKVPDLKRLTDVMRHQDAGLESPELIAVTSSLLLIDPKLFRNCIEFLKLPGIYKVLLHDSSWFTEYYKAGESVKFEGDIEELVWANQNKYLESLLKSANQLISYPLRQEVIKKLVIKALFSKEHLKLEILKKTDCLTEYYQKAHEILKLEEIVSLADKLKNDQVYRYELHYFVAEALLASVLLDNRSFIHYQKSFNWLYNEISSKRVDNDFVKCVTILTDKIINRKKLFDFRLASFRLNSREYSKITEMLFQLWIKTNISMGENDFLFLMFDRENKQNLLRVLISYLEKIRNPYDLLKELIANYQLNDEDLLFIIDQIRKFKNCDVYASDIRKILTRQNKVINVKLSEELKNLERKGRFWR